MHKLNFILKPIETLCIRWKVFCLSYYCDKHRKAHYINFSMLKPKLNVPDWIWWREVLRTSLRWLEEGVDKGRERRKGKRYLDNFEGIQLLVYCT